MGNRKDVRSLTDILGADLSIFFLDFCWSRGSYGSWLSMRGGEVIINSHNYSRPTICIKSLNVHKYHSI